MTYDFHFSEHTVYAHVRRLLEDVASLDGDGIVLDLGCGNAALAGAVGQHGDATYVGVDIDADAVARLVELGVEENVADLAEGGSLDAIVAGRRVRAILALDVVEHLPEPQLLLVTMRELASAHGAPIVLSVPNVTHVDVGAKLLAGRWDVTSSGLLDRTHLQHFSAERLSEELRRAGLRVVARDHFTLDRSDQSFPDSHPLLTPVTTAGRLMRLLRQQASGHGLVNQFVVACVPAPRSEPSATAPERRPFATVVLRTQGRREIELRETLLCLAAQTSSDFEVVLLGHRLDAEERRVVDRLLDAAQGDLAARTRLVLVEGPGRAEMLNVGFEAALGRYVVVLDDDDLVMADWIEQFASLERKHGGAILRARSALQPHEHVRVAGTAGTRATGGLGFDYDVPFSLIEHLGDNYSPFMTLAFPRGVWHDLGLRFDGSMTTVEDYDFLLRSAALVGVADHPVVTAIYRGWAGRDTSRTEHHDEEWTQNVRHIERKLDRDPLLLPVGASGEIRALLRTRAQLAAELEAHRHEIGRLTAALDAERGILPQALGPLYGRIALEREAADLLSSRSWRVTAWMRAATRAAGRGRAMRLGDIASYDDQSLAEAIDALRASRSWRSTAWLRRG